MSLKVNIDPRHDNQQKTTTLTINSGVKAAFVFVSTIALYYLAKVTEGLSYFGWRSNEVQSLGGRQILEVKNGKESVALQKSIEKVEQANTLSTTHNTQINQDDSFVEFEEVHIENLPERRSISVQNPMPDQIVIVRELFDITVNSADFFDSNSTLFLEAINVPDWLDVLFSFELVGSSDPFYYGHSHGIAILDNYAYVADSNEGLLIFDIETPSMPAFIKKGVTVRNTAAAVTILEEYAFVAAGSGGLRILDISDLTDITLVSSYDNVNYVEDVVVADDYAYLSCDTEGLQILDVSNVSTPVFVGSYDTAGRTKRINIFGDYVYVPDSLEGLKIIDVTNPFNPILVGSYDTTGNAQGVTVFNNYAYVAEYRSGLQIIDVSDPANPIFVGSYSPISSAYDIEIFGNDSYVSCYTEGLHVIDLTDPYKPILKGLYDSPSVLGVAISGDYIFLAADGIQVIKKNPSKIHFLGTPKSWGTYNVDIKACNDDQECTLASFQIIVKPNFVVVSIVASVVGVSSLGFCGLSVVCSVCGVLFYRTLKDDSFIQEETDSSESVTSSADSSDEEIHYSSRAKEPSAPDYTDEVELNDVCREMTESSEENVEYDEEPPDDLCCSISAGLMEDPVMVVGSGQTYDRESIETWFKDHDTDPLTGQRLENKQLVVNYAIKRQVEDWIEDHKK